VSDDLHSGQGAAVLNTTVDSAVLSSFPTADGVQTLIQISDADAPSEYRFPLSLPEGGQAALFDDGTVIISDASGVAVSGFRSPDLGTEWWGYYVQLTRAETRRVATIIANNQGATVAAGVVCSALPGPAAFGCGAAIALAYFKIIDPVNRANSAGKCVAFNYPWLAISSPPVGWTTVNATTVNCRR